MNKEIDNKREMTKEDLAYDRISNKWDKFISHYDTNRRIEVVVDDFLGKKAIKGKKCLDVGCGLGYFTQAIEKYHPSELSACDLSPNLILKLNQKMPQVKGRVADILNLSNDLENQMFDIVVCSDVIEHTPDPRRSIQKISEVIVPGGLLSISVPNRRWRWLLSLAIALGLRKHYVGYENYVSPSNFRKWVQDAGLKLIRCEGIHTIPFQLFPKKLLRKVDEKLRNSNYNYSLNLAILAEKNK